MSDVNARLFFRNFGAVIPATAVGAILFNTWKETSYEIDRTDRVINPLVMVYETIYASAIVNITDEKIAKQLIPVEETEEEEDEEEEKPKRRRGRPAKEEVVEAAFEPLEIEVVFFKKSFLLAQELLSESSPIEEIKNRSEKNERVVDKNLLRYAGLFNQLEAIRDNLSNDVSKASEELASVVDDMMPGNGERVAGIQNSAVEEYRAKQRRLENRVIVEIDATLDKLQSIINRSSFTTEADQLKNDIPVGDTVETVLSIVNRFFEEELVSME